MCSLKNEAKENQEKIVDLLHKMAERFEKGELIVTRTTLESFTHPLATGLGSYKLEITYYENSD